MGMNVAQLITDDYLEIVGKLKVQDSTVFTPRKAGSEEL
jgi:hypothetical protein